MIQNLYSLFLQHPNISIDTRKINKNCLFFALKGPNFNGNDFAMQAIKKGAAYAIVDEEKYVLNDQYILVKDCLKTLQELANYHRKHLSIPILGITGSNGKTTSKELCLQVLKKKFKTTATSGNLNNHIGVPLSILSIDKDTEFGIIEMGANHIGEIDLLCKIAEPTCGVITNIGKAHLEGFGSIEGVLEGKTELYKFLEKSNGLILVKDDQQLLIEKIGQNCRKIKYGKNKNNNHIISLVHSNPFLTLEVNGIKIRSQLIGNYNFDNIALSIALGIEHGISIKEIKNAIENYVPKSNRSQLINTNKNKILLDAYNANPTSMGKAIDTIASIEHMNKLIILGDMFELGEDTNKEHINIINSCQESDIQNVILVGKTFNKLNKSKFKSYDNTETLVKYLKQNKIKDTLILIKGSRAMKLEQLVEYL